MTEVESKSLGLFLRKLQFSVGGGGSNGCIRWTPAPDGQSLKY
jgi:hypothetical protein